MKYKQWKELPPGAGEAELTAAGIPALCAKVLSARGVADPARARRLLYEREELHDPMEMADMDKAVKRLKSALEEGETIAVYGDYDVDGITATCLLTDFLRSEGGKVLPYIPNRLEEGYGLNQGAVERLREQGAAVIVTVDCGITAVQETEYAKGLGLDVITTSAKRSFPPPRRWWTPAGGIAPIPLSIWRA